MSCVGCVNSIAYTAHSNLVRVTDIKNGQTQYFVSKGYHFSVGSQVVGSYSYIRRTSMGFFFLKKPAAQSAPRVQTMSSQGSQDLNMSHVQASKSLPAQQIIQLGKGLTFFASSKVNTSLNILVPTYTVYRLNCLLFTS